MRNEKFEEKIRRLMQCERLLIHETTANNIISVLEHGLMSLNEARARGIEVEEGGYAGGGGYGCFPNKVSLFEVPNFIKEDYCHRIREIPLLVIDEKYAPHLDFNARHYHHTYEGIIAPEDVLAVAVDLHSNIHVLGGNRLKSFGLLQHILDLQRKRLDPEKRAPVFVYEEKDLQVLYLPERLEISDEVRKAA